MIVSSGQPSLLLLFPFCMPIFSFLRTYLEMIVPFFTEKDSPGKDVKISYPFFTSFIIMLSNLVMGIPVAIVYCINKRTQTQRAKTVIGYRIAKHFLMEIVEKEKMKGYKVVYLTIFITASVTTILIANITLNAKPANIMIGFKMNIILIFLDSLFSFLILKYRMHRHHFVAIAFCIIGIIIVCLDVITDFPAVPFFSFLGVNILVSMVDITETWLMLKQFVNPSNLLFYIGLCGMVIYLFILTAVSLIPCPMNSPFCKVGRFTNGSVENVIEILAEVFSNPNILGMMILTICVGTGYLIFFFLTLFYYSPTHRCVSDILTSFIYWIYDQVNGRSNNYFGATLTGYLLIVLGSLVYNEIIILHCFGLDFNTKKTIQTRSLFDSKVVHNIDNNKDADQSVNEINITMVDIDDDDNEDS